ncbi:zinc finger BED domain-containing protein 4-like [Stomoxys calcitrans]|uniref:zinc finger BED domain-containing protein 4-like n=1 Tax=Stomoxys calcitrans TaxID=35570 RepID=UPI0027E29294|nr:zinc finger BED domain-containing protein 4-like [Stomoxys calcitrans]
MEGTAEAAAGRQYNQKWPPCCNCSLGVKIFPHWHLAASDACSRSLDERACRLFFLLFQVAASQKLPVTLSVLEEYEIKPEQIYSVTTDNWSNMLKAVHLMENRHPTYVDSDDEQGQLEENDAIDKNQETEDSEEEQVYAFYKYRNIASKIDKCRQLSKEIRTPTIMLLIKALNIKHPILDTKTRWNSTICMLERLLELRPFCQKNCKTHKVLYVPNTIWDFMEEFVTVMKPVKDATIALQAAQLVIGDFFGVWIKMRLEISSMKQNMAKDLMACLMQREDVLLSQTTVISALYLDPRYKSLLNRESALNAKRYLLETWRQIQNLKSETTMQDKNNGDVSSTLGHELSEVDAFLQSQSNTAIPEVVVREDEIKESINSFQHYPRITAQSDILEFWDARRSHPLYDIACVVLGVPATQVSVERNFSALKFIYNHLRCRLTEENLSNILLINLNTKSTQ